MRVHRWSGLNDFFMLSHRDHLAMGSGGHFGLWLDAELLHGSSGPSETFGNTCLCRPPQPAPPPQPASGGGEPAGGEEEEEEEVPEVGEFRCAVLELWGVDQAAIARRRAAREAAESAL